MKGTANCKLQIDNCKLSGGGGPVGEIGGRINPAGEPAYYGYRLPTPLNLDSPMTAEGSLFVPGGSGHFLMGFFNTNTLNGNYSYVITYFKSGQPESRPSLPFGPTNVVNGRIELTNLPTPPAPYDTIRIYRNLASDSSSYFLVGQVSPGIEAGSLNSLGIRPYSDSQSCRPRSDIRARVFS